MQIHEAYRCDELRVAEDAPSRARALIHELENAAPPRARSAFEAMFKSIGESADELVKAVRAAMALSARFGVSPGTIAAIYARSLA